MNRFGFLSLLFLGLFFAAFRAPEAVGQTNYTLSFDGTDDYVVADGVSSLLTGGDWTIEFWFSPGRLVTYTETLVSFNTSANGNRIEIGIGPSSVNKLYVYTDSGGSGPTYGSTSIIAGFWYHVVVSFTASSNTVNLYLNGNSKPEITRISNTPVASNDKFSFGQEWDTNASGFYKGYMDEVRIWNDIRTPREINENIYRSVPTNASGLVAYYNFDEGTGSILTDLTGNVNGSLSGTPTWTTTVPPFFLHNVGNMELVLYLDANSTSSYPGTGSTWTSLSNDATSYTLSGPTYNNNGYFDFDGSNDYVYIGSLLNSGDSYRMEAVLWDDGSSPSSRNILSSGPDPFWINGKTLSGGVGNSYSLVTRFGDFPVNTWSTVSLQLEDYANTMKLGYDRAVVSTNSSVSQSFSGDPLYLGSHVSGSTPVSFWNGRIQSVKVWKLEQCNPNATATGSITISSSASSSTADWQLCGGRLIPLQNNPTVNVSEVINVLQSGNLTIEATGSITFDANLTPSLNASRTLTLKAGEGITLNSGASISATGGALNTILWADSDANNSGGILLNTTSSIITNGGHIWMGGGSGTTTWNGLTVGDGYATATSASGGIYIDQATINTGAGDLKLVGKNVRTNGNYGNGVGIFATTGQSVNITTNNLSIIGLASANTGVYEGNRGVNIQRGNITASGVMEITGTGGGSNSSGGSNHGVNIDIRSVLSGTASSVTITGTKGANTSTGINVASSARIGSGTFTGDVSLITDDLTISADSRLESSGELTIRPQNNSATIGLGGSSGTLQIPASYLSTNFVDGFQHIYIGGATQTGDIALDAVVFNDSTTFQTTGNLTLARNIDLNNQVVTVQNPTNLVTTNGIFTKTGTLRYFADFNRDLNAENVAGLGATISTTASAGFMGLTEIWSSNTIQQLSPMYQSISRSYKISPANNTGLNAILVFSYLESELNGLNETQLELFRSTDNGATFLPVGGVLDPLSNTLTISGLDGFSIWTAGINYTPPTVTTAAASDIYSRSALLGGDVTSEGTNSVTERGIVYATTTSPDTTDFRVTAGTGSGAFAQKVFGLNPSTVYYARAYAISEDSVTYGSQVSFTTATSGGSGTISYTFTNAGATGNIGPDQSQINSAYGAGNPLNGAVTVSSGIQQWTVPASGVYRFQVKGGQGGVPNGVSRSNAGKGAIIYSDLFLTQGDILKVVVGHEGITNLQGNTNNGGGFGGGGSFVWINGQSTPLVVAGGGGGASITNVTSGNTLSNTYGKNGNTGTSGLASFSGEGNFGTNGGDATYVGLKAKGWTSMSSGNNFEGRAGGNYSAEGGFGGGGSAQNEGGTGTTFHAGGGGGGYSGGGAGEYSVNTGYGNTDGRNGGGGGGSYITSLASNVSTSDGRYNSSTSFSGSAITNLSSYNSGHGQVVITLLAIPPTVTAATPTSITSFSATLNGSINEGDYPVTERGFVYDTNPAPDTSNTKVTAGSGSGTMSAGITGLQDNTTYYVRAYAIANGAITYSSEINFTTLDNRPVISTDAVGTVAITTADVNGTISGIGGGTITDHGFVYSMSANPDTLNATRVSLGAGSVGSFATTLTGLNDNKTYYARAYALNSFGIAYGAEVSFKTDYTPPTVTTAAASDILSRSVVLGGEVTAEGSGTVVESGVVYGTSATPDTSTGTKVAMSSGVASYSQKVFGLTPGQLYYARAYAISSDSITYGSADITFTMAGGGGGSASTYTFTNAGATGRSGPTQAQVDATYTAGNSLNGAVTINTQGIQEWTVPETGEFKIEVYGAEGGANFSNLRVLGGKGAILEAKFNMTAGTPLKIVVGQSGLNGEIDSYNQCTACQTAGGSGGGASFVLLSDNTPLIIAAGGGGASTRNEPTNSSPGGNGLTTTSGGGGIGNKPGAGGANGSGGGANPNTGYHGGTGGGGLLGDGGNSSGNTTIYGTQNLGGLSISNGALGGQAGVFAGSVGDGRDGGFGGGGSGGYTGGGGGGYSGGGAGGYDGSGGGGSYITPSATNVSTSDGNYDGVTSFNGASITNLSSYNSGHGQVIISLLAIPPTVTAATPTSITSSSATLNGSINEGDYPVTERGFVYDTNPAPDTSNTKVTAGSGSGTMSAGITGLQESTTYYLRAYAIANGAISYSADSTFKTVANFAVLTTDAVGTITTTTAELNGSISDIGGGAITDHGFVYGTTAAPDTNDTRVSLGAGAVGTFASELTGLGDNRTYYVRAYAINSFGIAYGAEVSFKTDYSAPTFSTTTPSNIKITSAELGASVTAMGSGTVTDWGVVYGTSANPTTANTRVSLGDSTGTASKKVFGLTAATTYYVRAYAISSDSVNYGDQKSFTTQNEPVFTFTNAGATGNQGPTQTQVDATYSAGHPLNGAVTVSSGIQQWTVPVSGPYRIQVNGAQGGVPKGVNRSTAGKGAVIYADVSLNKGDVLNIVVGQEGLENVGSSQTTTTSQYNGGGFGGGGSFVWVNGQSAPLIVAGGGGGASITPGQFQTNNRNGKNGSTGTSGLASYSNLSNFGSNGGDASYSGLPAKGWNSMSSASNFQGRTASRHGQAGGFGGGGSSISDPDGANFINYNAGGGGGGYSGGGAAKLDFNRNPIGFADGGGGGGSFITPSATNVSTSDGKYDGQFTFNGSSISSLGYEYNSGHGLVVLRLLQSGPTLSTGQTTQITSSSAVISGEVSDEGDNPVTESGLVYGSLPNPTVEDSKLVLGSGAGDFSALLEGLSSSKTYYVRAYAISNGETFYSNPTSFITAQLQPPTITTLEAATIGARSAIVGAGVLADGSHAIQEVGVAYGTTTTPDTSAGKVLLSGQAGEFRKTIFGLNPETVYFARAYVISDSILLYGPQITFTTTESNSALYFFSNAAATGANGPSQSAVDAAYTGTSLDGQVTVTESGIQKWVVPATGDYTFDIAGAAGGGGSGYEGGQGAKIRATVRLTQGEELLIAVGQTGSISGSRGSSSGGGGTFVVRGADPSEAEIDDIVLIAGGGAGGYRINSQSLYPGGNGVTTTAGGEGSDAGAGQNGEGGNGGNGGSSGGGFLTDGNPGRIPYTGGSFKGGAYGAIPSRSPAGFGGGGGNITSGFSEAGAGGGFSGGGSNSTTAGDISTGGGSFIVSTAADVSTSDGFYDGSPTFNGQPIGNLYPCSYNPGMGYVTITRGLNIPTVTTQKVDSLALTTAVLFGEVTSEGDYPVTESGFVYDTAICPDVNDTKVTVSSGLGEFSKQLTGLTTGQIYYARAYAVSNGEVIYGEQVSFTPSNSLPVPTSRWLSVLQGQLFDPSDDQQATAETDLVGGPGQALLESQFTSLGSDNTAYYFRARLGNTISNGTPPSTSFYLGLDVNNDRKIDMMVEANIKAKEPYVSFHKMDPSKDGSSPSQTVWLNSTRDESVEKLLSSTESYIEAYTAGTDLDAPAGSQNSGTDTWLAFGFTDASLRSFSQGALGQSINGNAVDAMVALTSTSQRANGDIAGVDDRVFDPDLPWDSLDVFVEGSLTSITSITVNDLASSLPTPTITGGSSLSAGNAITVQVNGKTYSATTGSDGAWSVTVPAGDELEAGSYQVTASYIDDQQQTITGKGKLLISLGPPVLRGRTGEEGADSLSLSLYERNAIVDTLRANERVTWSITGGADASRFVMGASSGILTFVAVPDFEKPADSDSNNVYHLIVRAVNLAGNSADLTLRVEILDADEAPPVFSILSPSNTPVLIDPLTTRPTASVTIQEGATAVATIGTDEPATMALAGGAHQELFNLTNGGVLSLKEALLPGEYRVQVSARDQYANIDTLVVTVTRAKQRLTIHADTLSKVYGTADPALTYRVTGLLDGHTMTGVLQRQPGEDAGIYRIEAGTLKPSADSLYQMVFVPAQLIITPKEISLSGRTDITKVYDATTTVPSGMTGVKELDTPAPPPIFVMGVQLLGAERQSLGLLSGDTVEVIGVAQYAQSAVGQGIAITRGSLALKGPDAGNYRIKWANGSGAITPATLTVMANDASKFVTQPDDTTFAGVTLSGFVGGENESVVDLTDLRITRSNSDVEEAGSYTNVLTASGAKAENYTFVYRSGDFMIVPADELLVRLRTASSEYGAEPQWSVGFAGYFSLADSILVDLTPNVTIGSNGLFFVFDNAGGSAEFTIDVTNPTLSPAGEILVGTYPVEATGVQTSSQNFKGKVNLQGMLNVVAKRVVATVTGGATKSYDGSTAMPDLSLALSGVLDGDQVNVTGQGLFADKQAGGGKAFTVRSLALSGADSANYTFAGVDSVRADTGRITPIVIRVQGPTGVSKSYDGTRALPEDANSVGSIQGLLPGDQVQVSGSPVFAQPTPGKEITIKKGAVTLDGPDAGNYLLSWSDGVGEITTATLTIRPNDDAKFVTQADAQGYQGVSVSGFVGDDDLSVVDLSGVTIIRTNTGVEAAGVYPGVLVASGAVSETYDLVYESGNYTIVPADQLLIRVAPETITYGDSANYALNYAAYYSSQGAQIVDLKGSASVSGKQIRVEDGASGRATFDITVNSAQRSSTGRYMTGAYQLATSGMNSTSNNFSNKVTVIGALQVRSRGVNAVVGTAPQKIYDGTGEMSGLGSSLVADGVFEGDAVTISGVGTFADKQAGDSKSFTAKALMLEGADGGNYYLAVDSLTGTVGRIVPRTLQVRVRGTAREYDGTRMISATSSDNRLVGDDIQVSVSAELAVADAGTQPITVNSVRLTGTDAMNYVALGIGDSVVVSAKPVSIRPVAGQTKASMSPEPELTFTAIPELLAGDAFEGKLGREVGEEQGVYPITIGTLSAGDNYVLTLEPGVFTVTEARKDTDGDGVPDEEEEKDGTDPENPDDYKDTDGDGTPDYEEEKDDTDPTDPEDVKDTDKDGVPDYEEEKEGTDPNDPNDAPLFITTTSLNSWIERRAGYEQRLQAVYGTQPYTWSVVGAGTGVETSLASGVADEGTAGAVVSTTSLPEGMNLSAEGVLSGTPVVNGTYRVMIQVTDSTGKSKRKVLGLQVVPVELSIVVTQQPVEQVVAGASVGVLTAEVRNQVGERAEWFGGMVAVSAPVELFGLDSVSADSGRIRFEELSVRKAGMDYVIELQSSYTSVTGGIEVSASSGGGSVNGSGTTQSTKRITGETDPFDVLPGAPSALDLLVIDERTFTGDVSATGDPGRAKGLPGTNQTANLVAKALEQAKANSGQTEGSRFLMMVLILDPFGNPTAYTGSDTRVQMGTTSPIGKFFKGQTEIEPIEELIIKANSSNELVYYEERAEGTIEITASADPGAGDGDGSGSGGDGGGSGDGGSDGSGDGGGSGNGTGFQATEEIIIRNIDSIRVTPTLLNASLGSRALFRLEVVDASGQRVRAPYPGIFVELSNVFPSGQIFADSLSEDPVDELFIMPAESFTELYYLANETGIDTVRYVANAVPNPNAVQVIQITKGDIDAVKSTVEIQDGVVGEPVQVIITLNDAEGNAIQDQGALMSLRVANGSNRGRPFTTLKEEVAGTYTASYTPIKAGRDTVEILLSDKPLLESPYDVLIYQELPGRVVAVSGDSQKVVMGQQPAEEMQVQVLSNEGVPMEGAMVRWEITSVPEEAEGVSLSMDAVLTESDGMATAKLTVGERAGTYQVVARVANLEPVLFTAEVTLLDSLVGPDHPFYPGPYGFAITVSAGKPQAGDTVTVTAQFVDRGGNALAKSGLAVRWSSSQSMPLSDSAVSAVTLAGGSFIGVDHVTDETGRVEVRYVPGPVVGSEHILSAHAEFSAADSSESTAGSGSSLEQVRGNSSPITVQGGSLASYSITGPNSLGVGELSEVYTLNLLDEFGNTMLAPEEFAFRLALTGGQNLEFYSADSIRIASDRNRVSLAKGVSSAQFRLSQTQAGEFALSGQQVVGLRQLSGQPLIIEFLPGQAKTVSLSSGNEQQAPISENAPEELKVVVKDNFGNAVPDASVIFSLVEAPFEAQGMRLSLATGYSANNKATQGDVSQLNVLTDSAGQAGVLFTFGDAPGEYVVHATLEGSGLEDVVYELIAVPDRFELYQNYPNPFSGATTIPFDLPTDSEVSLEIFDLLGGRVQVLMSRETLKAGRYLVPFDARSLASDVYVIRLIIKAEDGRVFQFSKSMTVMNR